MTPNTIDYIGLYGPLITFIYTIINIWDIKPYLYIFFTSSFINLYTNELLKYIIKEPRPHNQIDFIETSETLRHSFGMPSCHSQTTFFSTVFLYLVKRDIYPTIFSTIISIIVLLQRLKYRRHTEKQLGVGLLIGSAFAWITYSIATKLL